MKVAWTIIRENKKVHGKLIRDDLIEELLDMGVPSEFANELLHNDRVRWETTLENGEKFLVCCDILPDSEDKFNRKNQ